MNYTKFGEFVRVLRIKNNEVMGDLAKVLNVPIPFLSAVENGKKNIPAEWENVISEHYNLSKNERDELRQAIEESRPSYKVSTVNSNRTQRKVAMQFARSFENIDDETANKIIALLEKKENN